MAKLSLCDDFIKASKDTWKKLRLSSQVNIRLSEETITDTLLLYLASRHPYEIRTQKYTKFQESKTGADWEWWITSSSSTQWLGLRIQAKIIDVATLEYPHLDYKTSQGQMQVDVLISNAINSSPPRIPLYVFYNYWDVQQFRPPWLCGSYPFTISMLGCGVSTAWNVRVYLRNGDKSVQKIASQMYPWSCLVCCRGFANGPLPFRILRFVQNAFGQRHVDFPLTDEFLTIQPPAYVYKILEGIDLSEEEWEQAGVKWITVIRENDYRYT